MQGYGTLPPLKDVTIGSYSRLQRFVCAIVCLALALVAVSLTWPSPAKTQMLKSYYDPMNILGDDQFSQVACIVVISVAHSRQFGDALQRFRVRAPCGFPSGLRRKSGVKSRNVQPYEPTESYLNTERIHSPVCMLRRRRLRLHLAAHFAWMACLLCPSRFDRAVLR